MSEIGTRPTDLPDWATTPTEYAEGTAVDPAKAVIKPTLAYQRAGWPLGKPVRQYMNWFMRRVSEWLEYLSDSFIRTVSTPEDGVAVTEPGETFVLLAGTVDFAEEMAPGVRQWGVAAQGTSTVVCASLDGQAVFCVCGSKIQRRARVDGASVWSMTPSGYTALPTAVVSVGNGVVSGWDDGTVVVHDYDAGTKVYENALFGAAVVGLATCGQFVAVHTLATIDLVGYSPLGLGASQSGWPVSPPTNVRSVCFAGPLLVAGHGESITAYYWLDGTGVWTEALATASSTPVVQCVASDGEIIVVGSEPDDDGATLHVYSAAYSGLAAPRRIWTATEPAVGQRVAVDDRYVYATYNTLLYAYDKRSGALVWTYAHGANMADVRTDGDAVFVGAANHADGTLARIMRSRPARFWRRCDPELDIYRRPFHHLVVPSE